MQANMNSHESEPRVGGILDPPRNLDIDGLTRSAFESFGILEPWYVAQKSFEHVSEWVDKVVRQADIFLSAVAESVDSVNDGWTFATDAVAFCDHLSSGEHSVGDLEAFRSSMLAVASAAHQRTRHNVEAFRGVRRRLYEISQDVPKDLVAVELGPEEDVDPSQGCLVRLPTPIRRDISDAVSAGEQGGLAEPDRTMKMYSAPEIIEQLGRAQNDLDDLAKHIGAFADWWTAIERGLSTTIPQMMYNNLSPWFTAGIRSRWFAVQQQYATYMHRVAVIEDLYPMLTQRKTHLDSPTHHLALSQPPSGASSFNGHGIPADDNSIPKSHRNAAKASEELFPYRCAHPRIIQFVILTREVSQRLYVGQRKVSLDESHSKCCRI